MQWPLELESKIVGMCLSSDLQAIVKDMQLLLKPVRGGSTANAFFSVNEDLPIVTICKNRKMSTRVPSILCPLYETYTDDTEFRGPDGLTFLSEIEMTRRSGCVEAIDFAYRYVGMGHIMVFTFVPHAGTVVSSVDGGGNGYDREDNAKKRQATLKKYVENGIFETDDAWARCETFVEWWNRQAVTDQDLPTT